MNEKQNIGKRKYIRKAPKPIPPRALQLLVFIDKFKREKDYSPSHLEMMNGIKDKITSTSVCRYYIQQVLDARLGFAKEEPHCARTVRLTEKGKMYLSTLGVRDMELRETELLKREKEIDKLLKESGLAHLVET